MLPGHIFLIHWGIAIVCILLFSYLTLPLPSVGAAPNRLQQQHIMWGLITAAVIAAIILLFSSKFNVNESFLFEVSKAKEKCMNEQVQGGSDRTTGCVSKDMAGVGSASPYPMTPNNWPYRADQVLPDQKSFVPPCDSCSNDNAAANANKSIPDDIKYPSKYQTLADRPAIQVESTDPKTQCKKDAIANAKIDMYVMENCPACNKMKQLLKDAGLEKNITQKMAKEHMPFLKSKNVKGVPFFICETGSCEGLCKDVDELISKLNIEVKHINETISVENPIPTPAPPLAPQNSESFIASETFSGSKNGYIFAMRDDKLGYHRDGESNESINDPVVLYKQPDEGIQKAAVQVSDSSVETPPPLVQETPPPLVQETPIINRQPQQLYQQSEGFERPSILKPVYDTSNLLLTQSGKFNENAVDFFVENFTPNYKSTNYNSKPAQFNGYVSYEKYLPDSVKYGSLAGQLTPPAPCGNSQSALH